MKLTSLFSLFYLCFTESYATSIKMRETLPVTAYAKTNPNGLYRRMKFPSSIIKKPVHAVSLSSPPRPATIVSSAGRLVEAGSTEFKQAERESRSAEEKPTDKYDSTSLKDLRNINNQMATEKWTVKPTGVLAVSDIDGILTKPGKPSTMTETKDGEDGVSARLAGGYVGGGKLGETKDEKAIRRHDAQKEQTDNWKKKVENLDPLTKTPTEVKFNPKDKFPQRKIKDVTCHQECNEAGKKLCKMCSQSDKTPKEMTCCWKCYDAGEKLPSCLNPSQ
jgi:hypothetical protein